TMPFTFKLSKRLAHSRSTLLVALATAFACAPGDKGVTDPSTVDTSRHKYPAIASVTIDPTSVTGTIGQTGQFAAVLKDVAGNTLTGRAITWSTNNPAVVSINATGLVTAVGAARTCTVLGLAAGTAYQAQVVAFRGTLNVNAVFGALSNVVAATTGTLPAPGIAPVAAVTISPAAVTGTVGQVAQLTANT